MAAVAISELSASDTDLKRLAEFYESLFIRGFPDADERESLENMVGYLRAKDVGWYSSEGLVNNYHILLGSIDGQTVAAAIFDYLARPNTGVIEFILVDDAVRGQRLGRTIYEAVEAALIQDAIVAGHPALDGIVFETNDPTVVSAETDVMDPWVRLQMIAKAGYELVDFPYVQPALSDGQAPVTCLRLCLKRLSPKWPRRLPSLLLRDIIHEYLRWAMRIPEPELHPVFQKTSEELSRTFAINTLPLSVYLEKHRRQPN